MDESVVLTKKEQAERDRYVAFLAAFSGLFLGVIVTGMAYSGLLRDAKQHHSAIIGCIPASGNEEIVITYRSDGDLQCDRRLRQEVMPNIIPRSTISKF